MAIDAATRESLELTCTAGGQRKGSLLDSVDRTVTGAGARLLHPVEANEVFVRLSPAERAALRAQGFAFYDWDEGSARFVAAWNTREEDARALAQAIASL